MEADVSKVITNRALISTSTSMMQLPLMIEQMTVAPPCFLTVAADAMSLWGRCVLAVAAVLARVSPSAVTVYIAILP